MSLCSVIMDMNRDYILMAADTRASINKNGKRYAAGEVEKIKHINGYLVFGCGKVNFINKVFDLFEKSEGDVNTLSAIINVLPQEHHDDIVSSFLVAACDEGVLNIYSLTQSNNYEVDIFSPNDSEVGCMTSGMKGYEAIQYLDEYLNAHNDNDIDSFVKLLTNLYASLTDEAIGGNLTIYKMDRNGIELLPRVEIKPLLAANNVTVNFARGGDAAKRAEAFVPYLNAGIQGLDRFFKAFKNPRTALMTLAKGGIMITAPEIIFYLINRDREEYKKLENRIKDTYYLIPTGDGNFIRIPKSRELGVLFGSLFQRVMRAIEGDAEPFKGFFEAEGNPFKGTVATNFAPANLLENNIFSPLQNLKSNKDFAGRNIVPQDMIMDKRSPYLQYDERTSELAKMIGALANEIAPGGISPKHIDYLIDAYTGIIGDILLPAATKGGNVLKSITSQFTVDPLYSNQTIQDFYELYDKAQQRAADKNVSENISGKIVTPEEKLRNGLQKAAEEIADLNKKKKQYEAVGNTNAVRLIQQQIIDTAKAAIEKYR